MPKIIVNIFQSIHINTYNGKMTVFLFAPAIQTAQIVLIAAPVIESRQGIPVVQIPELFEVCNLLLCGTVFHGKCQRHHIRLYKGSRPLRFSDRQRQISKDPIFEMNWKYDHALSLHGTVYQFRKQHSTWKDLMIILRGSVFDKDLAQNHIVCKCSRQLSILIILQFLA